MISFLQLELEALRRDLHQTRVALCRQVCHTCQSSKGKDSGTKPTIKSVIKLADLRCNL